MKKILAFYNFIITSAVVILGIMSAQNVIQLIVAGMFSPLVIYFWILLFPRKTKSVVPIEMKQVDKEETEEEIKVEEKKPLEAKEVNYDSTRRTFLKMIGSAGVSVFIYFLFTQKAEAAFFGSVPGPGTVALKDTAGVKIDPAEKHPTDGYRVSQLDDNSTPSYYGFINKVGAWFIMKEDSTGAYRYIKGASDFSTNWTNRASLSYDYYHNVF